MKGANIKNGDDLILIKTIVSELCADEIEMLGEDVVDEAIRGRSDYLTLKGGDNLDPTVTIAGVSAVINFTIAVLKLREEWRQKQHSQETTTAINVDQKKRDELKSATTITIEQQDRIIELVLRKK